MISIILPVYNVENYLIECFESILRQSYKEYELIVVDDGSYDNSLNIINHYKLKFENIKVFTQENKGVSEARNLALKHARGEYILFVDPDDFLKDNMLELMIDSALRYESDVVISNYYMYFNDRKYNKFIKSMQNEAIYSKDEVIDMMLKHKIQGQLWNKLFRHSLLKETNFKFESDRYIQDIFPVFRAISNANKISYIDEGLYFYRQRIGSTVNKKNKKLTQDYYHAMVSIIDFIEKNNINVRKSSLKFFKAKAYSIFIYHYTNESIDNNLKAFKNSSYNSLDLKFLEFLFLGGLNIEDKLRIFLWKLGVFNLIKRVKRNYE